MVVLGECGCGKVLKCRYRLMVFELRCMCSYGDEGFCLEMWV